MTSRFDRKTSILTIDCDEPGCRTNYECEPGTFRDGWAEARGQGWIYMTSYEKGVSRARHYCKRHAAKYDNVGG